MSKLLSRYVGCIFLIIMLSGSAVLAQNELSPYKHLDQYNYDHWTSDDGLPVNSIIHIIQSRKGYIWFVSYGGITRFNGVEFYTYSSSNVPAIVNNSYTHVFEDRSGIIWASSSGGGVTAIDGDSVKVYTMEDGLPSNFIEEVTQDTTGRIWVATSDGLYYQQDQKFINTDTPDALKHAELKSATSDPKGHLWVATIDDGLYELSGHQVVQHYTKDQGLASNIVNYVKYENKAVWVGTDAGLSVISDGVVHNITSGQGLQNNFVTSSIVDNNNIIWVGSYRGFCRINGDQYSYFSATHPLFEEDITSMVQDNEGNLWLGTYRQGLYKLWDGKFTNFSDLRSSEQKPFVVHSVLQKDEDTFIVVHQEGVNLLHPKENQFTTLDLGYDLSTTNLKHGLLDSSGNLWIATLNYLLKYKNGHSKIYNTENGLIHNNVRLTYEDSKGNIWVGTTNGITVISGDSLEQYTVKDGLSHEYIMSIEEDRNGDIWIGTRNGLNLLKDGHFTSFYAKDGMAGDFVFKTYEDSEGVIWICGNAGLTRYKNGVFTPILTGQGLASNTIFQILEDDQGYFWITTNQKNITVFKVLKSELNDLADGKLSRVHSIIYSQEDGLKSTAATSSAKSVKAMDGTLWFATNKGVEMIDPAHIKLNRGKPPVVIEKLMIDNKEQPVRGEITIPSGKQRVTIRFSALSYIAPKSINYRYRLVGYDDDWVDSGGKRETSYTNLPYGEYTFTVVAANSDGIWNDQGASISFYIKPAFYETNAFIVGLIVFTVFIGLVIYNLRVRSLKKAQRELAKIIAERTAEIIHQKEEIEAQKEAIEIQQEQIEHKNKELQKMNLHLEDLVEERTEQLKRAYKELLSVNKELDTFIYRSVHDVRGPIARLQGLSHLISLETSDRRVLELVNLLNLTADEMNDGFYRLLNIVRLKASELNVNEIDIKKIIDKVLKRLLPEGTGEKINMEVVIDPEFRLFSDKDTVEIILYQLLDNALKFKRTDVKPSVKIVCMPKDKDTAAIEVHDNGMGIDKEVADKIFDMFFVGQDTIRGAGLGLYTVRTAVKVLRGKVRLVTSGSEGTIFELLLPSNVA